MIEGLNTIKNSMVFHAGTILNNDTLTTNGGRVLCVTTLGDSVQQAQQHAYENVQRIHWGCEFYRSDIGTKAL
jgi:phosphoribosylamine--glycine ligase